MVEFISFSSAEVNSMSNKILTDAREPLSAVDVKCPKCGSYRLALASYISSSFVRDGDVLICLIVLSHASINATGRENGQRARKL